MISDHERDQLARISHRGLSGLKGSSVSPAAKLTAQNLQTLKSKSQEEGEAAVQAHRFLARLTSAVMTTFSGLFAAPTSKTTQCELYGHLLPRNGWEGYTPKCTDCGAAVHSGDQVRGATLLEERNSKSGGDNQTESGRKFVK